jgi:hypothetical protein
MPYCARCFIEYVEGTTQCEECGAPLLPGSPPEAPTHVDLTQDKDVKLVPVRIFTGGTAQMQADLARNILRSQGIPSVPEGENAAEILPVLDVPLLVREEDVEKANRVLQEYLDTDSSANLEDPSSAQEG